MDPITLTFNVDIAKLKAAGVDPSTSEGKLFLRTMFLKGVERYENDMAVTAKELGAISLFIRGEEQV